MLIGIDIGGTKTAVIWGKEDGTVTDRVQFPTGPWQETLDRCISILREAGRVEGASAVGISCGGPLDSQKGVIQSPPNLPGWDNVPVTRFFSESLGIPAFLENDANAGALAEWTWGAVKGCRNMLFLTFGTGLGAGIILDGRLYRGTTGMAGELGHWRLEDTGPEGYGKRGSFEGFCSGGGISRLHKMNTGEEFTAEEICRLAGQGDPSCLDTVETSARHLGMGLSLVIDLLNPQYIVLGSIFVRSGELFRQKMEDVIREEVLPEAGSCCRIVPSSLKESIGDLAALSVAAQKSHSL